jgi:hypothetical protein
MEHVLRAVTKIFLTSTGSNGVFEVAGDITGPGMVLRVGILARVLKIQKIMRPSAAISGGSVTVSGCFEAEGHFIQCLFGPDVASYVHTGSDQGGACM